MEQHKKYLIERRKREILQEYARGLADPTFMIEKYMKTVDLTRGGYVSFKLFPKQKEIVYAYEKNRHNLVTKPRQTGVSTTTAAYMAVKAAFANPDKPEQIIIIANKFSAAKKFLTLIRMFLGQLPSWVWGDDYDTSKESEGHIVGKGSTETLTLCNGSLIKAVATSPDALRGWTPTYLVVDEAAYIDTYADQLYGAAMAALSTGGKMIIISTPNGKDKLYYQVYHNSKQGRNNFNIVELRWFQDPRYNKGLEWHKEDDHGNILIEKEKEFTEESFQSWLKKGYKPISKWYKDMCANLNYNKLSIAKDLDVKFEGSAGTVVDQEWIDYHQLNNITKEYAVDKEHDAAWIFAKPIAGHKYIMGVDVSSGSSDDFSAIVIIDTTKNEQVFEYKKKIRPELLAKIVFKYGNLYNALTVIDTTGGYGDILVLKLEEMEYEYLYYSTTGSNPLKKKKKNSFDENKQVAGYKISNKRPQIIGHLTSYIESEDFKLRSERFLAELETFIWVNGRPDHQQGYNDDIIFAAALALYILEIEFKSLERAKEKSESILDILAGRQDKEKEKVKKSLPISNGINTPKRVYRPSRGIQTIRDQDLWVLGNF